MDAAHGMRDAVQPRAIVDLHIGDGLPLDESGDQRALRFDEGDDLGAHARDGCQPAGLMLDYAVDAQQRAGGRGDPDDEALPIHLHQIIPVRDAAAQRFDCSRSAGPPRDPIHQGGRGELDVHRCIAYRSASPATRWRKYNLGVRWFTREHHEDPDFDDWEAVRAAYWVYIDSIRAGLPADLQRL